MAESLVIGGQIELLGAEGGVASTIPACAGAFFTLGEGYDLGAPQTAADVLLTSVLDGERPSRRRASNRTFTLPVKITAPDRDTLAAAREVLLELCDEDTWTLTWTRDGGSPVIFDCFQAMPAQPANQLFEEQELVSRLTVTFPALPFGRSDETVAMLFNAPSQVFDLPPSVVSLDVFGTVTSFLLGDASTFEAGIATWVAVTNCAVARSTLQAHGGVGSLALTSSAAGTMEAAHCAAASIADIGTFGTGQGMKCNPGDTVHVAAWFRAAVSARTCTIGADFFDINGVVIGSTLRGGGITDSTSAWTQATATLTAPAASAYCRARPQVQSTAAGAEVHFVDDVTLDRGAVYSPDDAWQWSLSSVTPITSEHSAKWARTWHDNPVYDHVLPAAVDITGREKLTFWAGLATTPSQWSTWHQGSVTYAVTLYDSAGNSLSFSRKYFSRASGLDGSPHWQFIGLPIPQVQSGFDYTTVSRYVVSAFNVVQNFYGQVLQAGFYLAHVQAAPSTVGSPVTRYGWYSLPAVVGSARGYLAIQAAPGPSSFSTVAEFITPGSNNWTAPAGVSAVDKSEVWGAGGGGAGSHGGSGTNGGGGGGGGEYARRDGIGVTALSVYHPFVGAGGAHGTIGNPGSDGGQSSFLGNSASVTGHGGHSGWQSKGSFGGGKGGSGSTDPVHYGGGNGFPANAYGRDIGGGGGGAGAPNGGGESATDRPGADNVQGSGPGGNGGFSDSTKTPHSGSSPSFGPGGGGGGGADVAGGFNGGDGFNGKVRLTYGASGLLPLASLLLHMPGRNAPHALSPVCPVGNGADVPNGATVYTVPAVGALAARFDGAYTLYLVAGTWNNPSASRTVTVTISQTPYGGGPAVTQAVTRTLTPNTDVNNGYVDMGPVTLPLADLPNGNLQAVFTLTVTDTNTSDRFLDVALLDVEGVTLLVNVPSASVLNNIWVDAPDENRALGGVYGSNGDRDQSFSAAQWIERMSGGPFAVEPGQFNRLLVYSAQGAPAVTGWTVPHWWMDRVDSVVGL